MLLFHTHPKQNIKHFSLLKKDFNPLSANFQEFDFIFQISKGTVLFVGEGNLSFVYSLINNKSSIAYNTIATTYEGREELSMEAFHNSIKLKNLGVVVLHDIDATNLISKFGNMNFDTIIFQFPHTGSRDPVNEQNPNFVLVQDFLISAKYQLSQDGKIVVSVVDNDYYNNLFKLDNLANELGLDVQKYNFKPSNYPSYKHSMTHKDDSAIDKYHHFATWVFGVR